MNPSRTRYEPVVGKGGERLLVMGYWLLAMGERLEVRGNKQKLFKIKPKIN